MAARAMMLAIIATVRGVYFALEQPSSSQMNHFPDLAETGARIANLIGFWREQFLWGPQVRRVFAI